MATTSSNLTASKALMGRGGNGKGYRGRAAAVIATAALGLSLLVGGAIGQARQVVQQAAPQARAAGEDLRGVLPANVSMAEDFRWNFAPSQAAIPGEASTSADFRWDFGGDRVVRPADASTTTEYRWEFSAEH